MGSEKVICYTLRMIRSFKDLSVYRSSKELFRDMFKLTQTFPRNGAYLANQSLRAANSIHANIAEGFGRSKAEFCSYLTRALGSASEMVSHLEDAEIAHYADTKQLQEQYIILGKQIYRLRERWKNTPNSST